MMALLERVEKFSTQCSRGAAPSVAVAADLPRTAHFPPAMSETVLPALTSSTPANLSVLSEC